VNSNFSAGAVRAALARRFHLAGETANSANPGKSYQKLPKATKSLLRRNQSFVICRA
jgi:hypothetical protein